MKRKFTTLVLGALLLALSFSVQGQQTNKVPRIGILVPGSASGYASRIEAFRKGLHGLTQAPCSSVQ
jgi:hypothetical protein